MKVKIIISKMTIVIIVIFGSYFLIPQSAFAHCDTMDGPVVKTAQMALDKGDVTPVLKWVKKDDEGEIRALFTKTLTVRKLSPQARELADMYFFETLVRLHRAGEGAPYTGLKPAGDNLGPAVIEADKALETGSVGELAKLVGGAVDSGIHERFQHAVEAKKHADESVEAGREFVEAYVEYVHYVERLYDNATSSAAHHVESAETAPLIKHNH